MQSRREFIKNAALLSGSTGLFASLPEPIRKALAINPDPGTTYMDAEHVVILMQENRSFDHCFGTLRGVRGYNDPRTISLPNKNKVWLQTDASGKTYAPFRLPLKDSNATWMSCLPHGWTDQVDARNNGKYDAWLRVKRSWIDKYADMPLTLGYHTREDIPFYYAMADAFTICDQHFCSSLTGTTPNRLYLWTGTIRETPDDQSIANVWNSDVDLGSVASWATFPERLEDNGISWKIYQNELTINSGLTDEEDAWLGNYGDNPMEYFSQYHVRFHEPHTRYLKNKASELQQDISRLKTASGTATEKIRAEVADKEAALQDTLAELSKWDRANYDKLTEKQKNLHHKAFCVNASDSRYRTLEGLSYQEQGSEQHIQLPAGDILHQFREDVHAGRLPAVSWIVPPAKFSDHPSHPLYGPWYISEVMGILTKNPEVWKKTIFILTYDENDGYFDHVPPFTAPDPRRPETGLVSKSIDARAEYVTLEQERKRKGANPESFRESPIGLGYRVPMIIASPWSRGGNVCSEVFDHTSSIRFLESFLGKKTGKAVRENNISGWRRVVCGDLTSAFAPYHGEKPAPLPFLSKEAYIKDIQHAKFKNLPSGYKALNPEEIAQINRDPASSPFSPRQEKGIRPACALPYELYADGQLDEAGRRFNIELSAGNNFFAERAAGSPFSVCSPENYVREAAETGEKEYEPARWWSFAVAPGEKLSPQWQLAHFENGNYNLEVYGPNGFFRHFKGTADDPAIAVSLAYEIKNNKPTGNIILRASARHTGGPLTIEVRDNVYKNKKQTRIIKSSEVINIPVDLASSHHWYDLTISIAGNIHFERRYAGHAETGHFSFSDPFMGNVI